MITDSTVREATVDDIEAIQRVARRAWHETYGFLDEEIVEEMLAQGYSTEFLEEAIERPELTLFVAGRDGEVVGYASCERPDEEGIGQVSLYVDPDHWGEGFGTALLEQAESYLRELGASAVEDAVLADNEVGTAFYEPRFEQVGETTVELGGEQLPAVVYRREL